MAENVARLHGRYESVEEVQIGTANRGSRDLDDGIVRIQRSRDPAHSTSRPCSFPSSKLLSSECSYFVGIQLASDSSRRWGRCFLAVRRLLHFSDHAPRSVWLSLRAWNLTRLSKGFEVAQILDHCLLGISTDDASPKGWLVCPFEIPAAP